MRLPRSSRCSVLFVDDVPCSKSCEPARLLTAYRLRSLMSSVKLPSVVLGSPRRRALSAADGIGCCEADGLASTEMRIPRAPSMSTKLSPCCSSSPSGVCSPRAGVPLAGVERRMRVACKSETLDGVTSGNALPLRGPRKMYQKAIVLKRLLYSPRCRSNGTRKETLRTYHCMCPASGSCRSYSGGRSNWIALGERFACCQHRYEQQDSDSAMQAPNSTVF